MRESELAKFICPGCNRLLLDAIPSAQIYCSKCRRWVGVKPKARLGSTRKTEGGCDLKSRSSIQSGRWTG